MECKEVWSARANSTWDLLQKTEPSAKSSFKWSFLSLSQDPEYMWHTSINILSFIVFAQRSKSCPREKELFIASHSSRKVPCLERLRVSWKFSRPMMTTAQCVAVVHRNVIPPPLPKRINQHASRNGQSFINRKFLKLERALWLNDRLLLFSLFTAEGLNLGLRNKKKRSTYPSDLLTQTFKLHRVIWDGKKWFHSMWHDRAHPHAVRQSSREQRAHHRLENWLRGACGKSTAMWAVKRSVMWGFSPQII